MTRQKPGYHNFAARIPDTIWNEMAAESERTGASANTIVLEALRKHYKLSKEDVPPPMKPGRPIKKT